MAELFKNIVISEEMLILNQVKVGDILSNEPLLEYQQRNTDENELELEHAFQRGYQQKAHEQATLIEQQLNSLKEQFEQLLQTIPEAVKNHRLGLQQEIADIVLIIIQQFFIEKQNDPHVLEAQINHILNQLNNQQTIELYLHPQEIAVLHSGVIKLDTTHLKANGLQIKSDETLSLGGCIIKTDHGVFDANIEKQIDKFKELLIQLKRGSGYATSN